MRSLRVQRWIPDENIFVSEEVGSEKPDRKIFEYAENKMGLSGREIWFVGDAFPLDIEGALNAGWNAVWMNRRNREMPGKSSGCAAGAVKAGNDRGTGSGRLLCVRTEEELYETLKSILSF